MALKQKLKFFIFFISKSPWAHFLHVKAQKLINYRAPLYTIFFVSILVLIIKNFKKIVRAVFAQIAKKCYFGPNLPLLGPKQGRGDFFQKSVSFTFLQFWIPNFMPNFKKIVRAVFWEKLFLSHQGYHARNFSLNCAAPVYIQRLHTNCPIIYRAWQMVVTRVFAHARSRTVP